MKHLFLIALLIFLMPALVSGCANLLPKTVAKDTTTSDVRNRKAEAIHYFDEQRDSAEFEAAKNRWEQQHDANGCREGLEKLLARNPKHHDARLLMAQLLLDNDDPQGAYRHVKAALDLWPNDAQVQFAMATVMDTLGKTADALGYYERAAMMDPRNEMFQVAYHSAREASREEVRQRHARPTASDETAEGTQTGYSAPSTTTSLPEKRADYAAPVESAGSIANSGESAADLMQKGQTALVKGDRSTAGGYFFQAMGLQPENPQIPITAAAIALRANHADMAVELLLPAVQQFPNVAGIHRMLGASYYRSGDYRSAQAAIQNALSLDKSSALSYLLMGYTLAKLGQKDAAENNFRQARTLDPRYSAMR
jgi:tetratricopeptide (TPR) repeat protein